MDASQSDLECRQLIENGLAERSQLARRKVWIVALAFAAVAAMSLVALKGFARQSSLHNHQVSVNFIGLDEQVCSDAGKGCKDTGCCNDKSLTCFEKNKDWADCKPACEEGQVDPNSPDDQKGPWTCRVLTEPATSKVPCTCNLDDNSQLNRWSVGDQGSWTACRGGKKGCCTSSGLPCGDDDSTTGQLTTQPTSSQPVLGVCKCTKKDDLNRWKVGDSGALGVCKDGKPGCCDSESGVNCEENAKPEVLPEGKCQCNTDGDGWTTETVGTVDYCHDGGGKDGKGCCEPMNWMNCVSAEPVNPTIKPTTGNPVNPTINPTTANPVNPTINPNAVYCELNTEPQQLCPGDVACPQCGDPTGHCECPPVGGSFEGVI